MQLTLNGLDGGNPLAFLAALGTLRALTLALPDQSIRMSWGEHTGAYRPVMSGLQTYTEAEILALLHEQLRVMEDHLAFSLGDNLNVSPEEYRCYARKCLDAARPVGGDRIAADFAASFACDSLTNEQRKVQDTAMRTMSGAGHQHFLKSMRHIVAQTSVAHLRKALLAPWRHDDPVASQTLRWDPTDDSRYALQWRDPSGDPARRQRGGMLGANRLAIEGLPLMPCAPVGAHLLTTGFVGRRSRDTYWAWPIWSSPISLDVCRSLLAQPLPTKDNRELVSQLRVRGVIAAFRSQRVTVGKFRNFTPATAVF